MIASRVVCRSPLVRIAVLAALLALGACARADDGPRGALHPWTHPGDLRLATSLAPNTLNPILSTQQIETFAEGFVLEPLIATDERGNDVPVLAREVPTERNGGIARDGLAVTYRLRHGITWEDGAPLTSRDVAFTFAAIMNPRTNVATRHGWDQVARVETPDPYTAIFRLKRRFAPAVHTFFAHSDSVYFVLPAHVLAKYPDLNRVPFNASPVGDGPFKVARWVRGDHIEYVANDRFFLGRPKLRRVTLQIVPDENTIVSQLRSHELDGFILGSPRTYPQLRGVSGVDPRLVQANANASLMINTTRPPLDDASVRRALGLALDKARLAREVALGTALPAREDLPPFMWAYDPRAGTSDRDAAEAARLLDAAGWKRGPDGVRVRDGRRFEIGLAYRNDSATQRNLVVQVAGMLREAGVETQIKSYVPSLFYGPVGVGVLADGKYDAALQEWYAGSDPDNSTQLLCREVSPHGFNWSRYCSRAMDAAQADALSHYDRPTRTRAYARIEEILAHDAPFVYLWWPRSVEAVNTDLHGFRPNGIVESWNAWEWSLG